MVITLTEKNVNEEYIKLKKELFDDVTVRNNMISYTINGETTELRQIFWTFNILLLTMIEDMKTFNNKDLLTDTFNSDIFSDFVNKYLNNKNRHQVANILTEFSKISVVGNNELDTGLSLSNIIDAYIKYEDFRNIIDNKNADGTDIFDGTENVYEVERKFAEGIVNMKEVLKDKPDTWFYPFIKNGEGLNFKQLFQTIGFVGTKPVVNFDFRNNGVNDDFIGSNFVVGMKSIQEYYINCMSARKAQVVNRMLIQPSGYFMRRLSLLTIDTTHNNDMEDCGTKVTIDYNVKTHKELRMVDGRHYMINGKVHTINAENDVHLIGETINLRSPITCKHTHGSGVCQTCFGKELAEKLRYFNSGMLAVLNFTEYLTQNMLNAKHFSSTNAEEVEFSKDFYDIFVEDGANYFDIEEDVRIISITNYELDYSPEHENEETDDTNVTESIHLIGKDVSEDKFSTIVYTKNGKTKTYELENDIYLVLNRDIKIDYSLENNNFLNIEDYEVEAAYFIIQNNELATGMKKILAVIDNSQYIKQLNDNVDLTDLEKASLLLEKFNELLIYYKLDFIRSWNVEMIISNLFFDTRGKYFDFSDRTKAMEIYPVPKALREHGSLAVSLSYERLKDQFSDPATFDKDYKSRLDGWFK